ncbi:acetylcholinesterase-1-like [Amblyomma americanum]
MADTFGLSRDKPRDQRSRALSRRAEKRRHARAGSQDARAAVTEHTREKTPDSTKSVVAKTTHMRSAQALSFWSMYSNVAARVHPRGFISVADLVCALSTILAVAVLILSLNVVVGDTLNRRSTQVFVSGDFGHVHGLTHMVLGHTEVYAFLGVPYAQPPLEELRFRNTFINYNTTITKGFVIDGTQSKPACVQRTTDDSLATMSEDCLHLSIWTTSLGCRLPSCANKAVLVFLHDGSFQTGETDSPCTTGGTCLHWVTWW